MSRSCLAPAKMSPSDTSSSLRGVIAGLASPYAYNVNHSAYCMHVSAWELDALTRDLVGATSVTALLFVVLEVSYIPRIARPAQSSTFPGPCTPSIRSLLHAVYPHCDRAAVARALVSHTILRPMSGGRHKIQPRRAAFGGCSRKI